MLRRLLAIRVRGLFASATRPNAKGKRRSPVLMILLLSFLFLYLAVAFFFFFGAIFGILGPLFIKAGEPWGFFALASAAATVLMFGGSIIFTQHQLYDANDNEFLLSLPISPRMILASRMVFLLLINYLFEAVVMIPALAVFFLTGPIGALGVVFTILLTLALPFPVLALSCLFGWLVARISARIRKKQLVVLLFSLIFFGLYFYFISHVDSLLEGLSEVDIPRIAAVLQKLVPFAFFGRGCTGDILSFLYFMILSAALFFGVYAWLERTFFRTALSKPAAIRAKYREKEEKAVSPLKALTIRELRHLTSSAGYMLNAGFGLLFILFPPIMLLVKQADLGGFIAAEAPELARLASALPIVALTLSCVVSGMVLFSACSVSLEGKNLWIVRTSPVPTRTVLLSKVLFHIVPTLPVMLLAGILYALSQRFDLLSSFLLLLALAGFTLFSALLGLFFNLLLPKLEWKNEMVPIKQGASVFFSLLVSPLVSGGVGAGLFFLSLLVPVWVPLVLHIAFFLMVSSLLFLWIMTCGVRRFEAL